MFVRYIRWYPADANCDIGKIPKAFASAACRAREAVGKIGSLGVAVGQHPAKRRRYRPNSEPDSPARLRSVPL